MVSAVCQMETASLPTLSELNPINPTQPKADHLQLTGRPAWKTLFNPVLPDVCPGAGAKAQLPALSRPASHRPCIPPASDHWDTDFMQQTGMGSPGT